MKTETQTRTTDMFLAYTIEAVDLPEFLSRESDDVGEYLHVVPDNENSELRIYRTVEGHGDVRLQVTIPNARFKVGRYGDPEPASFYITGGEADTLMTALTAYRYETTHSPARVTLQYYGGEHSRGLFDDSLIAEETLYFRYATESGRKNEVMVCSPYRHELHKIARFN